MTPPAADVPSEADHLATLRPSRIREVQAGALAWTTIDLVDIGDGDGPALRGALESFGVQVNYLTIGQQRHLVAALGGDRPVAPYVVIAAHGDEGRILMDELDESVARYQPFNGDLGPDEVRRHLRLNGATVILTACDGGTDDLAAAFLDAGASAFVADTHAPFGYASVFVPIFLFYQLTQLRTLDDAVATLRTVDHELSTWQLFRR